MYLLEIPSPNSSVTSMTIQKNRIKIIFSLLGFSIFFFFPKIHMCIQLGLAAQLFCFCCVFLFFSPGHFKTSPEGSKFSQCSDIRWQLGCLLLIKWNPIVLRTVLRANHNNRLVHFSVSLKKQNKPDTLKKTNLSDCAFQNICHLM